MQSWDANVQGRIQAATQPLFCCASKNVTYLDIFLTALEFTSVAQSSTNTWNVIIQDLKLNFLLCFKFIAIELEEKKIGVEKKILLLANRLASTGLC